MEINPTEALMLKKELYRSLEKKKKQIERLESAKHSSGNRIEIEQDIAKLENNCEEVRTFYKRIVNEYGLK